MTAHTLKYVHKRRGFLKADIKAEPEKASEPVQPEQQSKPKITEDIVNQYIEENFGIVSTYLRNERSMKAQKKQMHVRSLLNNAFSLFFHFAIYNKRCRIRRSNQFLVLFSLIN